MDENKVVVKRSFAEGWIPHALVAAVTIVILVVLLSVQPWSANAYTRVNTFRLTIYTNTVEGNNTTESVNKMLYGAPNRVRITTTGDSGMLDIIIIGRDLYSSSPQGLGVYSAEAMLRSITGLIPGLEHTENTLESLADTEELENEEIAGTLCRHYRGRMDYAKGIREQIAELDPEQPNYDAIVEMLEEQIKSFEEIGTNIEVWVGKDDGLVHKLHYQMWMTLEGEWETSAGTLVEYYDINGAVAVDAPLDSGGELLPGWYLTSPS